MLKARNLVAILLALGLAGCASYSIQTNKAPPAPLNLTRLGIYFDPEWNPTVSGDTRVAYAAVGTVQRFAVVMNHSIAKDLPPLLTPHGVTSVTEPEPDLWVLYMQIGNVQRVCQANWGDCNTRVQIVGAVRQGAKEPAWAFETWMTPGSMDADIYNAFLRELVERMARDGAIPRKTS